MDVGTGIAAGLTAISVAFVVVKWFQRERESPCSLHSAIVQQMNDMKEQFLEIKASMLRMEEMLFKVLLDKKLGD